LILELVTLVSLSLWGTRLVLGYMRMGDRWGLNLNMNMKLFLTDLHVTAGHGATAVLAQAKYSSLILELVTLVSLSLWGKRLVLGYMHMGDRWGLHLNFEFDRMTCDSWPSSTLTCCCNWWLLACDMCGGYCSCSAVDGRATACHSCSLMSWLRVRVLVATCMHQGAIALSP
jgi:hypothetical protein